ncbi:MAG: hypothetical protein ACI9VR_004869 [Cognaticolwellia sp.]|jgi:uncharacterized protein YlxP (DUF503 family)
MLGPTQMRVAMLRVVLGIPGATSLKDKRSVVSRVRDRCRNQFGVSVAEVDMLDVHDRAVLGMALVSNDARLLQSRMDRLLDFVEELHMAQVLDHKLVIQSFS